MCGIFAYLGPKNNAGDIVLDGLKSLEYRGYDSWGVAIKHDDGKIHFEKHVGKIGDAHLPHSNSHLGIGHTRWATHGGVTEYNSHPHTCCTDEIVIVHNGIIENFQPYKKELEEKGHKFKSETDSEVIAHLIEEKYKFNKDLKKIVLDVFKSLKGLNAIIVFHPESNQFFAIKNSSPLVFGYNSKTKENLLASDSSAILEYAKNVYSKIQVPAEGGYKAEQNTPTAKSWGFYFLEDNELIVIGNQNYECLDYNGSEKEVKFIELDYKPQDLTRGIYRHYMIKEINEQPVVLQNIIINEKQNIEELAEKIKKAYGTYFIGCGTASYACLAGTYLFSKIANRHANFSIGSEFSYLVNFLKETSLVIALSQSGETIDVIESIKKAKSKQAKIFAITNVLGSTLYRMSDYKMLLQAGPEKAVASTKAFTAKIGILYLLAHALNGGFDKGAIQLQKAIDEVKKIIHLKKIKTLAETLKNKEHIYILGRGVSYPAALESTLKIKEVSYIHAEGFAGGELKHGVIALIEKGTPVIIYNPEDETYEDTLSSAHEVKARGAYVIGVSNKKNDVFDEFIEIADCREATIIPNVVAAQLLGYYLAVARSLDPDKPRNLAKSVTVK